MYSNKTFATDWAYSFVVWDEYVYVVTDEDVTEIDKKIGSVTNYSDTESLSGNFSNTYEKGTNYYSIKGISSTEAIAIQDEDGKYRKAIREGKYVDTNGTLLGWKWYHVLGIALLLFIFFIPIPFIEKELKK